MAFQSSKNLALGTAVTHMDIGYLGKHHDVHDHLNIYSCHLPFLALKNPVMWKLKSLQRFACMSPLPTPTSLMILRLLSEPLSVTFGPQSFAFYINILSAPNTSFITWVECAGVRIPYLQSLRWG